MKEQKKGTGKASRKAWKQNLLFAAVVLLLAAAIGGYYQWQRAAQRAEAARLAAEEAANRPAKLAMLTYGNEVRYEAAIDLREDADYDFASGGYTIHLQVRDGQIAFVNSPCPDHQCEGFGWLEEVYDWAACLPAQAMLNIVSTAEESAPAAP